MLMYVRARSHTQARRNRLTPHKRFCDTVFVFTRNFTLSLSFITICYCSKFSHYFLSQIRIDFTTKSILTPRNVFSNRSISSRWFVMPIFVVCRSNTIKRTVMLQQFLDMAFQVSQFLATDPVN